MTVAKSVQVDISVSGDVESKRKLDDIDARAETLKKAFPTYALKVDSAAASAKLGIFKADFKAVADAASKPITPQLDSRKALKSLAGIQATAEALKEKFPQFTVQINDKVAKAELDLFAAQAKVKLDKLDKEIAGTGSGGIFSKIAGLIPGVGGGSGGAASGASGAASGAGSFIPAAVPLIGGLGPVGGTAAVVAGLAAIPLAAQQAGAGIVFGLGGALAAMGILGASKSAVVQKQFANLGKQASGDLTAIGVAFVPVVSSILRDASTLLGNLTPVFANAATIIAGPFKSFGTALAGAFGQPAVQKSIYDVASSFGLLLKAVTPGLATDIRQVASGISKVAGAVAANPKAFADFVGFLFATAGGVLTAVASLTRFASYVEAHFLPVVKGAWHELAHVWDDINSNIIDAWDKTWTETIGRAIQGGHGVENAWNVMTNDIAKTFDIARNTIGIAWDNIELDALHGVQYILNVMGKLPGPLGAPFRTAARDIGNSMAGIQADVARRTAAIQKDIDSIHGKAVTLTTHVAGTGALQFTGTGPGSASIQGSSMRLTSAAAGAFIRAGTGPTADDVPAMLSRGELVVPASMVRKGAVDHLRGSIPGFASGGLAGFPPWAASKSGTWETAVSSIWAKAAIAAARAAYAAVGSGNAIAKYAASFLGKIPYVWGGTSLSSAGADCSGFTQSVYGHFGIHAPRTSEAQGSWVKLTPSPEAGGLAFYHSPPGGPDPGHVAIIANGSQAISQGGGMGPQVMGLHALPLLWTGIPPSGFAAAGGGGSAASGPAGAQAWMKAHLGDYNWGAGQWSPLLSLWNRESGWQWNATNPSSGAYGIPQSLPADKMASIAADWRTDPVTQMKWGAEYIRGVYGDPAVAWGHELSAGWYDRGGYLPVGTSIAVNNTGRPEQVIPHGGGGKIEVTLSFDASISQELSPSQLKAIRAAVRTKGGGNVQTAFGHR